MGRDYIFYTKARGQVNLPNTHFANIISAPSKYACSLA